MPFGDAATRRAALADLRVAFVGIRCAARLIARGSPTAAERSLAWSIMRAAARGERAVARLEELAAVPGKNGTAG